MPTLNIFELRQRLRNSVELLWRYWIFAGTVYRLKVAKFPMLSKGKVFTLPLQKENTCASETFRPNAHPHVLRAEAKISEIGWIPLDIGFLLPLCTGWKWENLKCFWCAKFSCCYCKSKTPALLKLCTHVPTFNIFELRQRFRKPVESQLRYRIFAGKVYRLKVAIISNVVDGQSFHIAIAKGKYLRIWNFPPKCPPSTSSSCGTDFENWLNTLWTYKIFASTV